MLFNIIDNLKPDKSLKRERITKACNLVENLLTNFTDNKKHMGYIVVLSHILFILVEFGLILFLEFTNINIIFLFLIILCHGITHLYYGGNGCIVTRIERHLFNDKDWYGMITIIYKIFNISITEPIKFYSEIGIIFLWTILIIHFIYRLLNKFIFPLVKQ